MDRHELVEINNVETVKNVAKKQETGYMQNMENRKEKRRMGKLIVIEGTDSSGKETQKKNFLKDF